MSKISTRILMNALQYYCDHGYAPIDVPLLVDLDVSAHTKPDGVPELYHDKGKVYSASAEQGFIQLYKEGKLREGMYMAVTPCYRHERYVSDTHYLMFMKLELISVGVSEGDKEVLLHEVTELCQDFFVSQGKQCKTQWNLYIEDSIDIIDEDGVELGSYGYREMPDGVGYIYATGVAFPRVGV